MTFKYKKELLIISAAVFVCLSIFTYIKLFYFKGVKVDAPIDNVIKYYNEE